ncbi:MAG: ECF transporter S component, partial [Finegoldia magna]|nr:ECF transporter S component [Finegoldia magna]
MNTKKITTTAIFIALTTFFTMVIKIPVSPAMGYVNLGDFIILLSTVAFGPVIGMIAAAFGSSLADLLLGYAAFAPFTFIVKGLMALLMGLFLKKINNQKTSTVLTAGIICELV